jgi:hypothetical protein
VFLQTNGIDAKSHPGIGPELYRIERYMNRLNLIKDKESRPKINKFAAGAFVRNALFDADSHARPSNETAEDWTEENDERPAKRLKKD